VQRISEKYQQESVVSKETHPAEFKSEEEKCSEKFLVVEEGYSRKSII